VKELRFTASRKGDVLVLGVSGEVGITTSAAFQQKLEKLLAAGEKKLILDLTKTSYIGSSGLGAISRAAKELREKGGELCLASVHYLSREVMKFFGLMPIVRICDTVEEAVKSLRQPDKT
jgi:anti-sigma B factor antagonist